MATLFRSILPATETDGSKSTGILPSEHNTLLEPFRTMQPMVWNARIPKARAQQIPIHRNSLGFTCRKPLFLPAPDEYAKIALITLLELTPNTVPKSAPIGIPAKLPARRVGCRFTRRLFNLNHPCIATEIKDDHTSAEMIRAQKVAAIRREAAVQWLITEFLSFDCPILPKKRSFEVDIGSLPSLKFRLSYFAQKGTIIDRCQVAPLFVR